MISLFSFILVLCVVSGVVSAIVIFGDLPNFRGTPIHKLRLGLPSVVRLYKTTNERYFNNKLQLWFGYTVPTAYMAVVTVCIYNFLVKTTPVLFTIVESKLVRYYMYFTIALVYLATTLAVCSDPGKITANTEASKFKNNQLIFFDNKMCSTCRVLKPARSKHCSTCGHCVLLFDHHCVWINNCVGYYNYKWFLLFLVANINLLGYGSYLCGTVLVSQKLRWGKSFWNIIVATNAVNKITGVFFLLCSIFVCITTIFTALHLRYLYLGVTTNELDKWSDIEYLVRIGALYELENNSIDNETYVEKVTLQSGEDVFISLKNNEILINRANLPLYNLRKIESVERDLINVYDRGFWNNLRERIYIH
ncbi:heme binding zinc finger protein [Scheffersomyces xylosifermentans]|uniref:heme binding zinc finger protein n=1 Tax=Scheffersomyces xylosifermentans TaxID=1304137 RepID=UPI00315D8529